MDFIRSKDINLLYFDLATKEYQDIWDGWKLVESKAQPLSAICGAFLAGVLAYGQIVKDPPTCLERIILSAIGLLLFYSIVRFIFAIKVVEVDSPYLGRELIVELDQIFKNLDPSCPLENRFNACLNDAIRRTIESCDNIREALKNKNNHLNEGLRGLVFSSALAVILMVIKLI